MNAGVTDGKLRAKHAALVKRVYDACWDGIGGEQNEKVDRYLNQRPKAITRKHFFRNFVWAVWVSGLGQDSANAVLRRARGAGFDDDYQTVAAWTPAQVKRFIEQAHGKPPAPKVVSKWNGVWVVAKELASFRDEREFRAAYWGGKSKSADLDASDIEALTWRKLPYVGPANAQFIVRNIGGEAVKVDRWVQCLLDWSRMTLDELLEALRALQIAAGLFDIVFWAYCEEAVGEIALFEEHFAGLRKSYG
jgi:hypothetical protein